MKTLVKSFNICYVWSAMLNLSILNLLQNNKVPISLGRVELFCLFVACSYTSKEDTMVSCHFVWVWSCMPKILWNNKSPISQERVKWFCQLFACSYFHLVIYPLKLQKICYFWDSQPTRLRGFLNLKHSKTMCGTVLILCYHWSYQKYKAILGYGPKKLFAN